MPILRFDTSESGGVAVVALAGELDLAGAERLEQEIAGLGARPGVETVVLDLRALEFMDSSGLRLIVTSGSTLEASGRELALERGPETVMRVFEITRMAEGMTFIDAPNAVAGRSEPPA